MSPEAAIQAYNEQVRAENAKVAPHAIRAYNAKAGMYEAGLYEQVVKKRGGAAARRLHDRQGPHRAPLMHVPSVLALGWLPASIGNGGQSGYLIWQPT